MCLLFSRVGKQQLSCVRPSRSYHRCGLLNPFRANVCEEKRERWLCYRSVVVVGSDVEWVEEEQLRQEEELQSVDSDELESYLHELK